MGTDTAPDLEHLQARHVERLRARDPLAGIAPLGSDGDARVVAAEDGRAVVVLDVARADPTTTASLWVEPEVARLRLRAADDDAAAGAAPLLRRAARAAPAGLQVHLTTASRDTALVLPLLHAGFAPSTVLAVRRLGDADTAPGAPQVRPARPDDEDAVLAARLALHDFETRVSLTPAHPRVEEVLRASVAEDLRDRPGWAWVAEQDGRVVGLCEATAPEHAEWVSGAVAGAGPCGYLGVLHVEAGARGRGVGSVLAATAHAALARQGARVVLLHHGATNPLSVPFWGRAGYRPLHTTWVRQPRGTVGAGA